MVGELRIDKLYVPKMNEKRLKIVLRLVLCLKRNEKRKKNEHRRKRMRIQPFMMQQI